ncbi:MAG: hypothetical protein AB2A00_14885 [Myxococcota bacterium]
MGFGRNPHVAKAEAAELKAQEARDAMSRERMWREAAHLWERAAKQEQDGKRRTQYEQRANEARTQADNPERPEEDNLGAVVLRMDQIARRHP